MKVSFVSSLIRQQGELAAQVREFDTRRLREGPASIKDFFAKQPNGAESQDNQWKLKGRLLAVSDAVNAALSRAPFVSPETAGDAFIIFGLASIHCMLSEQASELQVLSGSKSEHAFADTLVGELDLTREQITKFALQIDKQRPEESAVVNDLVAILGKVGEVKAEACRSFARFAPPSKEAAALAAAQLPVLRNAIDVLLSRFEAASPLVAGANAV